MYQKKALPYYCSKAFLLNLAHQLQPYFIKNHD